MILFIVPSKAQGAFQTSRKTNSSAVTKTKQKTMHSSRLTQLILSELNAGRTVFYSWPEKKKWASSFFKDSHETFHEIEIKLTFLLPPTCTIPPLISSSFLVIFLQTSPVRSQLTQSAQSGTPFSQEWNQKEKKNEAIVNTNDQEEKTTTKEESPIR